MKEPAKNLTHDQVVRVRRRHCVAVLDQLASVFREAGDTNNLVIERMHLEVASLACAELGKMILDGRVKTERVEFLTWLPDPPPVPIAEAKVPKKAERKVKEHASEYRRDSYEYRDAQSDPALNPEA